MSGTSTFDTDQAPSKVAILQKLWQKPPQTFWNRLTNQSTNKSTYHLLSNGRIKIMYHIFKTHCYPKILYESFSPLKFLENRDFTSVSLKSPHKFYLIVYVFFMLGTNTISWNPLISTAGRTLKAIQGTGKYNSKISTHPFLSKLFPGNISSTVSLECSNTTRHSVIPRWLQSVQCSSSEKHL